PVLLLDEPLTALDPAWQRRMLQALGDYAAMGRTVIASLHDLGLAAQMCDGLCVMHEGVCVALNEPEKALDSHNLAAVFHLMGEWAGQGEGRSLSLSPQPLPAY
ncbi:MAG: ABC transporter ATP-binding protein, partial [Asticcacaulis sp.]